MNEIDNGSFHHSSSEVAPSTDGHILERFLELLNLLDIDGDEFENTVLGDDADNGFAAGLVVHVDKRYPPGAALEHAAKCFVQGLGGVDGNGFDGVDADCLFDFCQYSVLV